MQEHMYFDRISDFAASPNILSSLSFARLFSLKTALLVLNRLQLVTYINYKYNPDGKGM